VVKIVQCVFGGVRIFLAYLFWPVLTSRHFITQSDGECAQTIVHPAISVWTVSTMPSGDIVTGCSDGVVRVFSADSARHASVEDLKAFDEQVAGQALPAQSVANMNNVQDPEALARPGETRT
jgi:phospholipase A-2-activating protein